MNRIALLLSKPNAPAAILVLAMLLMSSGISTGFFGDDYIHYALLSPENSFLIPKDASLFGLFSFVNGDTTRNQLLRDLGLIPWWTYDGLKYAFWRPLTELTHWLDHQLWPRSAAMMHIHNMLWYLTLCITVLALYRKISGKTSGIFIGAALALYALDATHGFAVAWISNRNSLIAATLGMASFLAYLTHREDESRKLYALSLVLLLASLLSAEAGVSTLAYLGAYALTLDKRGPIRGLLSVAPYGVVFISWWIIYKTLGFGAANADGYYVDPTVNLVFYLEKLAERIPVLLASQFGFLPAEIYGFAGKPIPAYIAACVVFLLIVAMILRPVFKNSTEARFWALGMAFALAPISSALPHDRNLIFVGIGASALMALLVTTKHTTHALQAGHKWKYATGTLIALNLYLGSALTPLTAYLPKIWNSQMQLAATELPVTEDIRNKNIILLGTPLAAALAITPLNYFLGKQLPQRLWILSTDQDEFTLHRVTESRIDITKERPFVSPLEQSLRSIDKYPFTKDEKIALTNAVITVATTSSNGQPTKLEMEFTANEQKRTQLAVWKAGSYQLHDLPAPGGSIRISTATD